MTNKKYQIHPWKVEFLNSEIEQNFETENAKKISRSYIILALIFIAFSILTIHDIFNPNSETRRLSRNSGFNLILHEELPQLATFTLSILTIWLHVFVLKNKNFRRLSYLFLSFWLCNWTYNLIILPNFTAPLSFIPEVQAGLSKYTRCIVLVGLQSLFFLLPVSFLNYFFFSLYCNLLFASYILMLEPPTEFLILTSLFTVASYITLITVKYGSEIKNRQQFARILQVQEDLEDAREMQISLIPEKPPSFSSLEISARNIEAREVGGDFFNYFLGQDKIRIAVADVSGKGLKAAMNAVMASGILELSVETQSTTEEIVSVTNNSLCKLMEQDMNMTMVLAEFDIQSRQLKLANAGQHAYPMLIRNNEVRLLKAKGLALGIIPSILYKSLTVDIESGDLLLFMTDGITEPRNEQGRMYDESGRLRQFITRFVSPRDCGSNN